MKTHAWLALLLWLSAAASSRATVNIEWVTVGNAGNANDVTGYGAVAYVYQISKYETTNAQYVEFLNAKAATDTNGLYNIEMGTDVRGGIIQSGSNGSFTYGVKPNMGDKPVNFVSFSDSIRFANWLHNGQGGGSTESGAYDMTESASTVVHASNASVWIPTENEWYKAAYYQPVGAGGPSDSYWLYPTRSDTVPTEATAGTTGIISNPGTNVANYNLGWPAAPNGSVTTVGSAGPLSASYYGTLDQGGNVSEWNEAVIPASHRGLRGGNWYTGAPILSASHREDFDPANEVFNVGFRLARAASVYVADPGSGTIRFIDPSESSSTFATDVPNPVGLALDKLGNLYIGNYSLGQITRITTANVRTTFASGINGPMGLAFDYFGNLFVANYNGNSISKITPSGTVSTFVTGLNYPNGLAFDSSGDLYVSDGNTNSILRISPLGSISTFATGINSPQGLAFDAFGNLFVANNGGSDTVTKIGSSLN